MQRAGYSTLGTGEIYFLGGVQMPVRVRCPKCGTAAEYSESLLGEIVQCPSCRQRLKLNNPAPHKDAVHRNHHEARNRHAFLWRKSYTVALIVFAAAAQILVGLIIIAIVAPPNADSPEQVASAQNSSLLDKVAEEPGKVAPAAPGQQAAPKWQSAPIVGEPVTKEPKQAKSNPYQEVIDLAADADRIMAGQQPKQAILKPLTPEALYAMASPAVVRLTALNYKSEEIGQGTGFFVRADGWLLTNHHVIQDAKYVRLTTATGKSARADSILAWDEKADLAVIVVDGGITSAMKLFGETRVFPCLELAPGAFVPAIGSKVWAIGNPQGLANSLSEGIVSGLRSEGGVTQVQCTAAVSPGSSGGPLLDCYGRVLGVMKSIHTDEERLSQNLNFAVSSEAVRGLLSRADRATPQPVGKVKKSFTAEEMIAEARSLVEKRPGEAWSWFNLGQWLNMAHRWAEARDAYQKSLQLKPNDASAFFGLAKAQWGLGDYAGVNQSLRQAEAVEPNAVNHKVRLGEFYNSTERHELAIRILEEAIRLDPRSIDARRGLIGALVNMGKNANALLQCDELERLDPEQGRSERNIVLELMRLNEK